jgi:hypothetical protein
MVFRGGAFENELGIEEDEGGVPVMALVALEEEGET